jgi:hypothetical protein
MHRHGMYKSAAVVLLYIPAHYIATSAWCSLSTQALSVTPLTNVVQRDLLALHWLGLLNRGPKSLLQEKGERTGRQARVRTKAGGNKEGTGNKPRQGVAREGHTCMSITVCIQL